MDIEGKLIILKIADKLSELSDKAIASRQEKDAELLELDQANRRAVKQKQRADRRAKEIAEKNLNFIKEVDCEILLAAWEGKSTFLKKNLTSWQIELLEQKKYIIKGHKNEIGEINNLLSKLLPESVEELQSIANNNNFEIDFLSVALSQKWRKLDIPRIKSWLASLSESIENAMEIRRNTRDFQNANKDAYNGHLSRLDPFRQFVRKNIDEFDRIYGQKLSEKGLFPVPVSGTNFYDEHSYKRSIMRRVLTDLSDFSWERVSDPEISTIFFATRDHTSMPTAALKVVKSAIFNNDDLEIIDSIANFVEGEDVHEAFFSFCNSLIRQVERINGHLNSIQLLAEKINLGHDDLKNFSNIRGFLISVPDSFNLNPQYQFLIGKECEKLKSQMHQKMMAAAKRGNKTISLKCKEYRDGIDISSNSVSKVFLPFSMDMFLKFNQFDGFGYEVYDEGNFKFTINLLWN